MFLSVQYIKLCIQKVSFMNGVCNVCTIVCTIEREIQRRVWVVIGLRGRVRPHTKSCTRVAKYCHSPLKTTPVK